GRDLIAISLGATFFGALTYVGNAPNLLVKTIAEHARVPTPSFIGYIWKFALPVLLPVFALLSILFFPRYCRAPLPGCLNVFLIPLRSDLTNAAAKVRSWLSRSYERIHHHRYCSDSGCERAVLPVL